MFVASFVFLLSPSLEGMVWFGGAPDRGNGRRKEPINAFVDRWYNRVGRVDVVGTEIELDVLVDKGGKHM